MNIKHIILLPLLVLFSSICLAQQITVRVSPDKQRINHIFMDFEGISFVVSEKADVKLKVLTKDFGNAGSGGNGWNAPPDGLLIDYYDRFSNYSAGKVKSVGGIQLSYYDQFDWADNRGKVKQVGPVKLLYRDVFDGVDNRGKIKALGGIKVTYYDRFDGKELNGKLKSIGNTVFKYYDAFDDAEKRGRIKSVTGHTEGVSIVMDTDDISIKW